MGKYVTDWNTPGVYKITTLHNNEFYIGSAVCYNRRISLHITNLKKNKHHSTYLQNVFNKYGIDDLKFELITSCCKEELMVKEQYYIDTLNPKYNSKPNAYSNLGFKHPRSFYEKMCIPIISINIIDKSINRYNSIKECSKIETVDDSSISAIINKKRYTVRNKTYIKDTKQSIENIYKEVEDIIKIKENNIKKGRLQRLNKVTGARIYQNRPNILQYDLKGNFIKEWRNVTDICKYYNTVHTGNLCAVLQGKRSKFQNYIWKYKI